MACQVHASHLGALQRLGGQELCFASAQMFTAGMTDTRLFDPLAALLQLDPLQAVWRADSEAD